MDHISKILPKVLQKRGLSAHTDAALVVLKAQEWLKEHAGHLPAPALRMAESALLIDVSHGIVAQELTSLLPKLRSYLEGELRGRAPRVIRIGRM